jgi:hypothetical protein
MKTKMRKLKKRRGKQQASLLFVSRVQHALEFFRATSDVAKITSELGNWKNFSHYGALGNDNEAYRRASIASFVDHEMVRESDAVAAFQRLQSASSIQREHENLMRFRQDIENASLVQRIIDHSSVADRNVQKIQAFQREFATLTDFQRHFDKASAYQLEVDRAALFKSEVDNITKLTAEMKRRTFLALRHENYTASLRLEGLESSHEVIFTTLDALKAKYER